MDQISESTKKSKSQVHNSVLVIQGDFQGDFPMDSTRGIASGPHTMGTYYSALTGTGGL